MGHVGESTSRAQAKSETTSIPAVVRASNGLSGSALEGSPVKAPEVTKGVSGRALTRIWGITMGGLPAMPF